MGEDFHEIRGIAAFREIFSVNFMRMHGSADTRSGQSMKVFSVKFLPICESFLCEMLYFYQSMKVFSVKCYILQIRESFLCVMLYFYQSMIYFYQFVKIFTRKSFPVCRVDTDLRLCPDSRLTKLSIFGR